MRGHLPNPISGLFSLPLKNTQMTKKPTGLRHPIPDNTLERMLPEGKPDSYSQQKSGQIVLPEENKPDFGIAARNS
jgi:hypothetical protein